MRRPQSDLSGLLTLFAARATSFAMAAEPGVPRPTLYVTDRNKTVRLRYREPTYRSRPDLDDLVLLDVQSLGL